jgi:hypothetical protein
MLDEQLTWARIAEAAPFDAVMALKQSSRNFFGWISSVDGHLYSAAVRQYL